MANLLDDKQKSPLSGLKISLQNNVMNSLLRPPLKLRHLINFHNLIKKTSIDATFILKLYFKLILSQMSRGQIF